MRYALWIVLAVGATGSSTCLADELPEDTNQIKTLTVEQAKAIMQRKGERLSLNGLTTLSDEAATALAQYDGDLDLQGLTTLSPEAAAAFAKHKGHGLALIGLRTLSCESAEALANFDGLLALNGLIELSGESAKALARHRGDALFLNGLTTLSQEVAESLSQHNASLHLRGLTRLTDEAAKALARHKGYLYLGGLTALSGEAAALLRSNPLLGLNDLWATTTGEAFRGLPFATRYDKSLKEMVYDFKAPREDEIRSVPASKLGEDDRRMFGEQLRAARLQREQQAAMEKKKAEEMERLAHQKRQREEAAAIARQPVFRGLSWSSQKSPEFKHGAEGDWIRERDKMELEYVDGQGVRQEVELQSITYSFNDQGRLTAIKIQSRDCLALNGYTFATYGNKPTHNFSVEGKMSFYIFKQTSADITFVGCSPAQPGKNLLTLQPPGTVAK